MKNPMHVGQTIAFCRLSLILIAASTLAQSQQTGKSLVWAYPVPDPPPTAAADPTPKKIPGSTKSYTQAQIDDQFNPPDWFPDEHGPLPNVVQKGIQAQACGSCHLMSGHGHPESATLAGLPVAYMLRQMADFKSGVRKDPMIHESSQRAARMNIIAAGVPDEEMRKAVEWFAGLKPAVWYKVVEAQTVPKTWVNGGRMRLPPRGGWDRAAGQSHHHLAARPCQSGKPRPAFWFHRLCATRQHQARRSVGDHRRLRQDDQLRDLPR